MTAYKITSTTSRFSSSGSAFHDHTSGADSLTVDEGAYLVATSSPDDAATLDSQGAWTVTINGSLYAAAANGFGIYLTPGNTAVSTIKIGATGEVAGGTIGIYAYSAVKIQNDGLIVNKVIFNGGYTNSLTNTGTIGQASSPGTIIDGTGSGALTINNSGDIFGNVLLSGANDTVTNSGTMGQIDLGGGNNKLTTTANSSTSIISGGAGNDTVSIAGDTDAAQLGDGNNSFTMTSTGRTGHYYGGSGNDVLKIAGRVDAEIALQEGNNSLTVTGHVDGEQIDGEISAGAGNDTIVNSGYLKMVVGVYLGNGTNVVTNSKTFIADLTLGADANTVTNSGTFTGDIDSSGTLKFTNSGTFAGEFDSDGALTFNNTGTFSATSVTGSGVADTFNNKKMLTGDVFLGAGEDIFTNNGTIDGDVFGQNGHDIFKNTGIITGSVVLGSEFSFGGELTNSGTIEDDVQGGLDADHVTNTGHIGGLVDLGEGDDFYTGSNFADEVADGFGADTIKLGGGNDFYDADGGASDVSDTIDGGVGIDTYQARHADASGSTVSTGVILINIDTIFHNDDGIHTMGGNTAYSGVFDKLSGFENVTGGTGADTIYGNAAVNVLDGGDGNDSIFGYGGNDLISGGAGADVIGGGTGADRLQGGTDADRFIYSVASESGPGKVARDTIVDFQDGTDRIDMRLMDSDSKTANTQHNLHFAGTNVAFGLNDAGEVRAIQTAAGYTIEADLSGDGKADFAIDILDSDHSVAFSSSDFLFV